jgi:hypothetical protein
MSEEQTVQKIEWLQNSFVTEWPELNQLIQHLSPSSPESVFIRIQIIVSSTQPDCFACMNICDYASISLIITLISD